MYQKNPVLVSFGWSLTRGQKHDGHGRSPRMPVVVSLVDKVVRTRSCCYILSRCNPVLGAVRRPFVLVLLSSQVKSSTKTTISAPSAHPRTKSPRWSRSITAFSLALALSQIKKVPHAHASPSRDHQFITPIWYFIFLLNLGTKKNTK